MTRGPLLWIACLVACCWLGTARATLVVLTPHPDDAEASCGGLIANTVAAGEPVVIVTMTGGELGVWGKSPEQARELRSDEARSAAAVLGATVEFFGAVDAALAVDAATTKKLKDSLLRLRPSVVLAPWPLDVHSDHQATGMLAWRAFQDPRSSFELYFYETSNAPHTRSFQFVPTHYVDITDVLEKKRAATHQHRSQGPADWFDTYVALARVHGFTADVGYAEAYLRARNSSGLGGRAGGTEKTLPVGR